jgi:hypothetical protein
MKNLFLTLFLMLFSYSLVLSQTDITEDTKLNMPNDWGKTPSEKIYNNVQEKSVIPDYLMQQYKNAKLNHDESEKIRLGQEMDKYLNAYPTINNNVLEVTKPERAPMMETDWGIGDYAVYTGNVASAGGFRQLDMKMGEDGNLYIAINRGNVSGINGYIAVYRSTNGGKNWLFVSGAQSTTLYFGQISMLVEKRHATNDDSTRIILYFTLSSVSTQNDAELHYATFLRGGGTWYSGQVLAPTAGNKIQYPSACSDGMYYGVSTYIHCVAQEVTNAGVHFRTHHTRTTNWCQSHSVGTISTSYADFYPSAAFSREVLTSSDSIYVAVERRFSATGVGLRLLILPEVPSTAFTTYYLTGSTNVKYEKPCITVQQAYSTTPRQVLVTCTKDTTTGKTAKYTYSTNSGSTWSVDANLGFAWQQSDFTWCNSDTTTAGGGYFIAAYVDLNGDSIAVRRGVLGSMGTVLHKRNAHASTGVLPPVVAIYKEGGVKYSAFAYAGYGPTNVYANQENLAAVNIEPISGNVPKSYNLNQNYPNPFNPATTVTFDISKSGLTTLKVYNILGVEVATLVNENLNAGTFNINFDASGLSNGVYFYKLVSGEFNGIKKMMLLK